MGDETKFQQPHCDQHQTTKQGEQGRGTGVVHHTLRCDCTHRRRGHQRCNGDRADREGSAAAKQRVGDQRQDRRIQPHFGRQPRQQRIGQRLGYQHDGDDDSGQAVVDQTLPIVASQPLECRQSLVSLHEHSAQCRALLDPCGGRIVRVADRSRGFFILRWRSDRVGCRQRH